MANFSAASLTNSIIYNFIQRAKDKSVLKITKLLISKLVLLKYRLQYPQVKFGKGVKIRGAFSIKGNGKVLIGDYTCFVGSKQFPNEIIARDVSASVAIGNYCKISGANIVVEKKGTIKIGNDCYFENYCDVPNKIISTGNNSLITIGNQCYLNGAKIVSESSIEIEKLCMVSDALLMDTDAHSIEIDRWNPTAKVKTRPIYICENVWIGSKSAILKGVTVGKNSVIGLGTIVRQEVPESVVVIGNPQQIVKHLDTTISPYEFPKTVLI